MNKKQRQAEDILRHGFRLKRIFDVNPEIGPVALCKQLHRIETRLHHKAEDYCNGLIDMEKFEQIEKSALKSIDSILHFSEKNIPIFINADPRGYAIKIDDKYVRENNLEIEKDWGGYGIIAPEF